MVWIFLGAVIVSVWFSARLYLFVCGYSKTTFPAMEKSSVKKKLHLINLLRFWFSFHHFLAFVKKFLWNNRFMLSFVKFAVIADYAVIKRILKYILEIWNGKQAVSPPFQAEFIDNLSEFFQGIFSGGVGLKCLFDRWRFFFIHINLFCFFVVVITERGHLRPKPIFQFLPMSSFYIFRKIINVVFWLPESDWEHEFSLRCRIKPKSREF